MSVVLSLCIHVTQSASPLMGDKAPTFWTDVQRNPDLPFQTAVIVAVIGQIL